MLNVWVFELFICICLDLLSFYNNLTSEKYLVQKKLCHLDPHWQSYIEIFIFAKMMTKQWRVPRIVWALAGVQTILGARHCLVMVFSENKDFDVTLSILVQIT